MKSKAALGRGLGALLGEMEKVYDNEIPSTDSVLEIPLKNIQPNPYQPRKHFNEESLLELSESIKHDGLLQPIVVIEDIDGYILVSGERRLRASKLAKLKTIRAICMKVDDEKMRQLALIENIQRDELNAIELATAYDELIKIHNITHEDLAVKIHKSRTNITNTMRLLQLSKKTQKALIENKISSGHARALIGLDEKDQQLVVDSIIGQKLSVRDVESMVKSIKNDFDRPAEKNEKEELDFSLLKTKLEDFGLKVSFKSNKMTVEFSDQDKIEQFLSQLS
ncbi:ParB/RepB/Spo0J family partition protein [Sulfurimonas sp. HSL3-2]|uniref:ParB/RepB/Spo0J family partition protein n=1 Tax=Hydrocurvibacter mobilis TaxID=3131936 RepID=UPI0031FA2156